MIVSLFQGTVRFDENGTRIYPRVRLKQYVHQGLINFYASNALYN